MPICTIFSKVFFEEQEIIVGKQAILLRFNDRFTVIDPANNNALIEGMTANFKLMLEEKGLLHVHT